MSSDVVPPDPPLSPREHGAYGQIFLPLAIALCSSRPNFAGSALALAATCAFFAHEPLLVLLGQRGQRIRRVAGARARRRLIGLSVSGGAAGLLGLWVAPAARAVVVLPVALGLLTLLAVLFKRERSLAGELLAALALSSCAVPVASAAGLESRMVLGTWSVWALGFAAVVWAVRAAIAGSKRRLPATRRVLPILILLLIAAGVMVLVRWSLLETMAFSVIYLAALTIAGLAPHPRHLHRVGWTLMAVTSAAGALLIAAAHV